MQKTRTYNKSQELVHSILQHGDFVNIGDMKYRVVSNHLMNLAGGNSKVFALLGMNEREKEEFCDKIYGYRNQGGDFPTTRHGDMAALTRVAHYLMKKFEDMGEEMTRPKRRKTNLHRLIDKGYVRPGDVFIIAGWDVETQDDYLRIGNHMHEDIKAFMKRLNITRDDINRAYDPEFVQEGMHTTLWPEFADIYDDNSEESKMEAAYRCVLFLLAREEMAFGPQYNEELEREERREAEAEEKRNKTVQEAQEFIDDVTYVIDKMTEESEQLERDIDRLVKRRKLMLKEAYGLRKERLNAKRELEEKIGGAR